MKQDAVGTFNGPMTIKAQMERYVKYFEGEWFVGETVDSIDMSTACSRGGSDDVSSDIHSMCILGMVLTYDPNSGFLTMRKEDLQATKESYKSIPMDESASSKGTIFVIFSAIPDDKDTWYYVEISPYGVGIFKSQKLIVSTVDVSAVGLGVDILYQSYFVCVKESSGSTVIEYGKSLGTTERGDVYLTMIDLEDPLFVRFWSFGNGDEPLEIVDAHIVSRHLTKANCRGDTVLDKESNMCVQNCHALCDPNQGCRRTSSSKPLVTDCNACRYVKNGHTGECLQICPEGWERDDKVCNPRKNPCKQNPCLHGGTCAYLGGGNFKCTCLVQYSGETCEN
ncbi:hypothetical protein OS493_021971, partial [Desmophyllum pertusum]